MARIRTIKPEFFTSEDIVSLTPLTRLLYIALWCEADREGRFEWKPKTIKLRYLPGDGCDIDLLATELIGCGLVHIYESEGKRYAEIPSFKKHQVINNRESESSIPPRVAHASTTRKSGAKAEGKEGMKGKEGYSGTPQCDEPQDDETPSAVVALPLIDKTEFDVTAVMACDWQNAYPAIDVAQQLKSMRAWLLANPENRKTRNGIERFIVRWLAKAQNTAPRGAVVRNANDDEYAGAI